MFRTIRLAMKDRRTFIKLKFNNKEWKKTYLGNVPSYIVIHKVQWKSSSIRCTVYYTIPPNQKTFRRLDLDNNIDVGIGFFF